MTSEHGPLGIRTDDRHRTIPEARIVQMLLLTGYAYEADSPAAQDATKRSLQNLINNGLGYCNAAEGTRLFDPVEVNNFQKRAGLDGRDDFWATRSVPTLRRLVSDLAGEPSLSANTVERKFVVEFRRTFFLRSIISETRLRLRMPLPLEGVFLRDIQVKDLGEIGGDSQTAPSPGRLEVRMTALKKAETVIGARSNFTAFLHAPNSDNRLEPDRQRYLAPHEGLIVVTEKIRLLANSLSAGSESTLETVRALWEYFNNELIPGSVHYDQIDLSSPCDHVLDSGWYDCQLGAALWVALCRARGIPARIIGGYQLYKMAPAKHYWPEVWIEDQGWTPFDFLSWDLAMGGRDPKWRDHFFGHLDYRMTTERFPREFTGSIGVPLPAAWHLLHAPSQAGVEISFLDLAGNPIYVDQVRLLDG